jgi:penicillin G amidase
MSSTSTQPQRLYVDGLQSGVEIVIDRYGIPHIYADNDHDVFMAQGFNAARDRLWQLDLWRRRGLGLLAQSFGARFVARDRAARLMLYRGDIEPEWQAYGEDAKAWIEAFVAGINAYIALVASEHERLPVEFVATDTRPSPWEPEDVVRCRGHARVRNLDTEVARTNVAAELGLDRASLVKKLEPPWELKWPDGLPEEPVPAEVLTTYRLATTLVDLTEAELDAEVVAASDLDGSNNWALRPDKTATGRALLATDPHRLQELPSLRYTVHLNAPGLNIIGSGEPAIPGVSLGHNERIAFGLTIFPTDQEDLCIYELDPNDPGRYRYGDAFEPFLTATEAVPVRGQQAQSVSLQFSRHGPVLHVDPARGRAYAIRSVWTEPGTAAYMASLRYQRAANWEDFVQAQDSWGAPSVNHVYADVDGNVGWITAGKLPVRPNWDGLLPVPGDGRYEWQGFMDAKHHPREYNPARSWVGSANHMNLPPAFEHARHKTGFEFAAGGRFKRITEVLEGRSGFELEHMAALQADVQCQAARQLTAALSDADVGAGEAELAKQYLLAWDHELSIDSGPAALFEVWFRRHLIPAVIETVGTARLQALVDVVDTDLVLYLLTAAPGFAALGGTEVVTGLLKATLTAAWRDVLDLLGADPDQWRWGTLHQVRLHHPLSVQLGATMTRRLDIGPLPKSGSALTVNNNGYRTSDFQVIHGVSWRMLADVGNWDACQVINSPGQSGDPASPHYADHFPLWAKESYVPLLFSRAAIEAAAERRIMLVPSNSDADNLGAGN